MNSTIYRITDRTGESYLEVNLTTQYEDFKKRFPKSEVTLAQFRKDMESPTLRELLQVHLEEVTDAVGAKWEAEAGYRRDTERAQRSKTLWKKVTLAALAAGVPVADLLEDSVLTYATLLKWAEASHLPDTTLARVKRECAEWKRQAPERQKQAALVRKLQKGAAA